MVTLLAGLVGGFVATIVMTAFMMGLGDDSPPPTAVFWSQYVGDGPPEEYMMQGLVMHLGYGTGAGSVLALLSADYLDLIAVMDLTTVTGGVVNGLIYGFLLFLVAATVVMNLILDMDAEPPEIGMFLFFHLVYGVVLGAFLGAGVL